MTICSNPVALFVPGGFLPTLRKMRVDICYSVAGVLYRQSVSWKCCFPPSFQASLPLLRLSLEVGYRCSCNPTAREPCVGVCSVSSSLYLVQKYVTTAVEKIKQDHSRSKMSLCHFIQHNLFSCVYVLDPAPRRRSCSFDRWPPWHAFGKRMSDRSRRIRPFR